MVKRQKNKIPLHAQLREQLKRHRGAINLVAEKAECSRVWVSYVLGGKHESEKVLLVASEVLKELEKKKAAGRAKIKNNIKTALSAA